MIKKILILALVGVTTFFLYKKGDLLLSKLHLLIDRGGQVVYFVPYLGAPSTEEEFVQQDCYIPYRALERAFAKRGYQLKYSTLERLPRDADYLLVINQHHPRRADRRLTAFPKERKVAFVFEPPIIEPKAFTDEFAEQFAAVYYALTNDLSGAGDRRKFHFPHPLQPLAEWPSFEEKRLCTLVSGNKYSSFPNSLYLERLKAIDYFERYHPESFALYGRGWSQEEHPAYQGAPLPEAKCGVVSGYRFSICYENSVDPGNITEKIFDSFCAGCVPVYWGAPDITDWVPKDCFIDRTEFANLEALYAHLSSMDRDEYEGYLARIRRFLASEQASIRSTDQFCKTAVDAIDALRKK